MKPGTLIYFWARYNHTIDTCPHSWCDALFFFWSFSEKNEKEGKLGKSPIDILLISDQNNLMWVPLPVHKYGLPTMQFFPFLLLISLFIYLEDFFYCLFFLVKPGCLQFIRFYHVNRVKQPMSQLSKPGSLHGTTHTSSRSSTHQWIK